MKKERRHDKGERRSAVEMMERCHRKLEQQCAELCDAARALAEGRGSAADLEAIADALHFLARTGGRHIADEEESVFPELSGCGELTARLAAEHREQERMLASLEAHAGSWGDARPSPESAAPFSKIAERLARHLREHARLEDAELLPALGALDGARQQRIAEAMQERRGR